MEQNSYCKIAILSILNERNSSSIVGKENSVLPVWYCKGGCMTKSVMVTWK